MFTSRFSSLPKPTSSSYADRIIKFPQSRQIIHFILNNNSATNKRILLPSFICSSVFESVPNYYKIIHYDLNDSFYPDYEDLLAKSQKDDLILLVNYFGFTPHDPHKLKLLTDAEVMVLLDCALSVPKNPLKYCHLPGIYLFSSIHKLFGTEYGGAFLCGKNFTQINATSLQIKKRPIPLKRIIKEYFYKSTILRFLISPKRKSKLINTFESGRPRHQDTYLVFEDYYSLDFNKEFDRRKLTCFKWQTWAMNTVKDTWSKKTAELDSIPTCYPILMETSQERDELLTRLFNEGVDAYTWPTFSPNQTITSKALDLRSRLLCLPLGNVR